MECQKLFLRDDLVILTRSKLNNLRFTFLFQNKKYPTVFTDYLTVWSLIKGEEKEWNSECMQRLLLYWFTNFLGVSNSSWDNFSPRPYLLEKIGGNYWSYGRHTNGWLSTSRAWNKDIWISLVIVSYDTRNVTRIPFFQTIIPNPQLGLTNEL